MGWGVGLAGCGCIYMIIIMVINITLILVTSNVKSSGCCGINETRNMKAENRFILKPQKKLLKQTQPSFWSVNELQDCHGSKSTKIEVKRRRWRISSWADGIDRATGNFQIPTSPQDFKPCSLYEPLLSNFVPIFKTGIRMSVLVFSVVWFLESPSRNLGLS